MREKFTRAVSKAQDFMADAVDETQAAAAAFADQTRSRFGRDEDEAPAELTKDESLLVCRALVGVALIDREFHPREISSIYVILSSFNLSHEEKVEVRRLLVDAQRAGYVDHADLRSSLGALDEDRREFVCSKLVRHMVELGRADGDLSTNEREYITEAAALGFPDSSEEFVAQTERLVKSEEDLALGRISTSQFETVAKDVASKLVAFGAPVAAVSMVGSVTGLSAAGITSGLAALGFGGVLGLSAMVTGIGAAVLIGVVVHQGVRYALATNERSRKKQSEYLIQQIIVNHQRAISELTEDVATLTVRLADYLSRTSMNESTLAELKQELAAFQLALSDLRLQGEALQDRATA